MYMKAYKSILIFLITLITFSNALAFDCENEQEFAISEGHWLHELAPEVQYYAVLYLSEKTVEKCLDEKLSDRTETLRANLEHTIGNDKLKELEESFIFLFDTRSAFEALGLDIMDENFLQKLRNFDFSKE